MVYVVVTAYKAGRFIEECLDSLKDEGVNILLGIDGCKETLAKVRKIKKRYPNLRAFYFPINKGTYITKNSLIRMIPKDGIYITFDSDDVMCPGTVKRLVHYAPSKLHRGAVYCIPKELHDKLGGFRPWRIAADTDFIGRLSFLTKVKKLHIPFYRRQHPGQLTKGKNTSIRSRLRQELRKAIFKNIRSSNPVIYIEPEYNDGYEIK